jgi:D-3-phosphoglycerate dehydrogenase
MPKPLVLLTNTPRSRDAYYGIEALAALRAVAEVRLHEGEAPLDAAGLAAAAAGARVIVADRATAGDAYVFAACPDLLAFVRCAVDVSTVDIPAASAAGVLVTQASPGFAAAVAELVLGLTIDLGRGVSTAVASYWAGDVPMAAMGRQIAGSVVGVIGYGVIGRHLVGLLKAMGAEILVADPFAAVDPALARHVVLGVLLEQADFVICLAASTTATEALMDEAAFAAMKPGAFFVNAARGNLVDEAALAAALDSGRLAGAALDVGRAADQMPSPTLARRRDVIATPHIGGLTRQAVAHQAMETTRQVADILNGRLPQGALNAAAATRLRHG